jgi:hypothetical protein
LNYDGLGKTPTPATPTPQPDPTQAFMNGLAGANVQNQAQLTEQQQRLQESQKLMKDAQMLQGTNPDQTAYDQRITQLEEAYKGTMGKGEAYKQQLEQAGVLESQKRLADLNILMAQQQAAFNQGMLDTEGKVIPMRFITGQQAQMQKQYAVTAGNTAMMAQALQGNITMAKQTAMDTVDLEYADREAELEMQKQMLELNYDKLTRSEKKRADELNFMLQREEARIAEEKATKKEIQNVAITLASYGVNPDIVNKVMNSQDMEEAIALAGTNLQSPEAKAKLESIRLDQILTKAQIAKTNYEMEISRKYGGLTPAQYAAMLKEEQTEIAAAKTASEQAEKQGVALQEKIVLLDSVLKNKAIDSVVGPSILTRKPTGFKERVMTGLIPFAGPILQLQGAKDSLTGDADRLIGQTEQFISKEFLDSLIDVKAQGATFGALQKAEQDALTSAASYIGQRRITKGKGDDRQVIGYDMSEKDFIKELTTIKTLTQKAYEKATGKVFGADEAALLDEMFNNSSLINPGQYY